MPPGPHQPLAVHHCWRRVFDFSMAYFTEIEGYGEKDAALTADAAVNGWYTARGSRRAPRPAWKLPRLGELIKLGEYRGIWTCDPAGAITHHTDTNKRLPLWWSESTKICVVFPKLDLEDDGVIPSERSDRLMQMWTNGTRGARKSWASPRTPEPIMRCNSQVALAVEYYSDKFKYGGRRRWVNYVHHHENGVRCSTSRRRYSSNHDPMAIALRGGKLRITPHGLEG